MSVKFAIRELQKALRRSGSVLIIGAMSLGVLAQSEPSYQVVDRGAGWRAWSRTIQQVDPISGVSKPVVQQYTELEDGACYQDPQTGQWMDSQSLIEIAKDGTGVATHGQAKAIFANNLHGSVTIDLQSRGGRCRSAKLTRLCSGKLIHPGSAK